MHSFMIERLRVSGPGKIDGVINFTDGLNIIQGRSNTGKTWILKCIYYLFSSDTRPFSPLTGYTDIEGVFLTKRYGRITLSRKLDEEKVTVVAESDEVEDGEYDTNYKKTSLHYLNDLWLRIIGLDETIEVPKTARYARERMSWTNIASVFFADENEIDKSESIVIKDQRYETPLIASLYFLLTGDYKKGIPEITKPEVATAKKKAVIDYIEEQVASLTEKRVSYIMQLEELAGLDIEKEMQELSDHIQEVQQEIKELIEENAAIVRQMAEYQQGDANCRVLLDRYESLISQYKADLQRLDFISKGEQAVKGLPENGVCPFCGGELHTEDDDSYLEAINAEIKRIASELTVIAATENSVRDEQESIRKNIEELQVRRAEVNKALDDKNSEIQNYRSGLQRFKDYTTLQTGIDFVNDQLAILGQKKLQNCKNKKILLSTMQSRNLRRKLAPALTYS